LSPKIQNLVALYTHHKIPAASSPASWQLPQQQLPAPSSQQKHRSPQHHSTRRAKTGEGKPKKQKKKKTENTEEKQKKKKALEKKIFITHTVTVIKFNTQERGGWEMGCHSKLL
jgi:hypothetical protein